VRVGFSGHTGEIVERVRAKGHVNKLLVRLEIDGDEPLDPGTKLAAGESEIGEVTSSAYSPESGRVVALGYVRTPHADATALRDGARIRAIVR
jgi:tRNA-modifying protein YgfZ